ncbi:MAG: zinc-ribbon domain-containing protein [Desulfobulbaceae bacterium]
MLVICEDCARKYNIDETRIRGRRARFTCNACGHIIIVDKDDLTRSLLTGKPAGAHEPTLDLLREMEVPLATLGTGAAPQGVQEQAGSQEEQLVNRKNRGIPVFVYFIIIMLISLACISFAFGYLYSGHLQADHLATQPGLRTRLLMEAALFFGVAGCSILVVFCILARSLHAKLKGLIMNANQISAGDYEITIATTGPQEIRDLAFALERIRNRLKAVGRR